MGDNTAIEWTDATFNPWIGCMAISPACDHCYAKTLVERWGGDFSERKRTSAANWKKPLTWNRKAQQSGKRMKVFCASLADVFDNQVPEAWRAELWEIIATTPWLDWQLLTKRPQNIHKFLPRDWCAGYPNVWLGTTAEDKVRYRQRWPYLSNLPAAKRFLSYEPALGPIPSLKLESCFMPDWVICGGESGPGARPMHPDWAREVREQCATAGVPFFFKQWGEWTPGECGNGPTTKTEQTATWWDDEWIFGSVTPRMSQEMHRDDEPDLYRLGKKAAGAFLDGVEHKEFPI